MAKRRTKAAKAEPVAQAETPSWQGDERDWPRVEREWQRDEHELQARLERASKGPLARLAAAKQRLLDARAKLESLAMVLRNRERLTTGERQKLSVLRTRVRNAERHAHTAEEHLHALLADYEERRKARRKAWMEKHGIPDAVKVRVPRGWEGLHPDQTIDTIQRFLVWCRNQHHFVALLEREGMAPGVAARNAHLLLTEMAAKNPGMAHWPPRPPGDFSAPGAEAAELQSLIRWAANTIGTGDGGDRPTPAEQLTNEKQDAKEATRRHANEQSYLVREVREMIGCGNTALNKYAKLAKVLTPGRGCKNHRYSCADTVRILQTIIEHTAEEKIAEKCRNALAKIAAENHF